jgi:hypothetical protein
MLIGFPDAPVPSLNEPGEPMVHVGMIFRLGMIFALTDLIESRNHSDRGFNGFGHTGDIYLPS